MYFEEIKQRGPWPYGGAVVTAVKPSWRWRWSWWVEGSPRPSRHSLLCTLCEFMRHCVLPGKSHLWACWSEELLKLALAGYWATGLAGCTPAFTSDVNHSFASLPCAIQKYFVTLLVGSFLKCYFKSPKKRETWKCRPSIPVRLDAQYSCEIQSTIVVTWACCYK